MFDGGPSRAIIVRDGGGCVAHGPSGIGRTAGGAFASAGAKASIIDLDEAAVSVAVSRAPDVGSSAGDPLSPQESDRAISDIRARFGGLVVNNVGVAGPIGRIGVDGHV